MHDQIQVMSIRARAEQRLNTVKKNENQLESELIRAIKIHEVEQQIRQEDCLEARTRLEGILKEYEDLFELSPVGYFILDRNGLIERANARAGVHFGFDPKTLVGRDFSDFLADHTHKSHFVKHMEQVIEEQQILQLECEVKKSSGTIFSALVKSSVVKDHNSNFKHLFTILTDLSKVKEHEHQIEASLTKAERMNEMFSSFMSIASHEFRTPLSAVLSSNSLVEKYAKLGQTDMMQKHLMRIKSSVKVMVSIIEDFLSLEKLEGDHVEILETNFNLVSFCEDLIEEIRPQNKPDQVIKYNNIGNPEIHSDKKVMQHIVLNLLSNACKYSPESSEVFLTTDVSDDRILITVTDAGIGIPETQQENIFKRFFRARNAASIQGTGLGLYICKRYVELLNGTITFTSETNRGTTFIVHIPQTVN